MAKSSKMRGKTKQSVAKKAPAKKAIKKTSARKASKYATRSSARSTKTSTTPTSDKSKVLPQKYTASTDTAAGIVTLTDGERSMGIQMKSFDAVANALSALTTTKRFKSSTITVQLGERPITIPASAFPDVAKAVATFGLNGASPEDAKVEPISNRKLAEKAGVSLLQPSQATPPAPAPASPSPAAPAPAAAKSKPAPSSEGRKSRRPARPSQDKMPKWFEKDFNKEYTFAEDHYSMRRARLSIDPQRSKKVLGEWKKKGELSAWGYEILTGKKHVGWVIAEEQNHFVITGVPDMAPSDHRAFIGVLARIATTIIPEIRRR